MIEPNIKLIPTIKPIQLHPYQDVDWDKVLEQIIRDMGGNDEPYWNFYI